MMLLLFTYIYYVQLVRLALFSEGNLTCSANHLHWYQWRIRPIRQSRELPKARHGAEAHNFSVKKY